MNIPLLQPHLDEHLLHVAGVHIEPLLEPLVLVLVFLHDLHFLHSLHGLHRWHVDGDRMVTPAKAEEWLPANKPQRTYLLIRRAA